MLSKIKKTRVVGLREAAAVVYRVGGLSGFFQVHFWTPVKEAELPRKLIGKPVPNSRLINLSCRA